MRHGTAPRPCRRRALGLRDLCQWLLPNIGDVIARLRRQFPVRRVRERSQGYERRPFTERQPRYRDAQTGPLQKSTSRCN